MATQEPEKLNDPFAVRPRTGAGVFGFTLFTLGVVLLALITEQTKWIKGVALIKQPSFWPGLCLIGLVLFGALHLVSLYRSNRNATDWAAVRAEMIVWLRPCEYAVYFMVYVFGVSILGYLPATLIFCPALAIRAGYRTRRTIIASMVFGLGVVLIFKTFLSIKIPGGALYDTFPDAMRNFFMLYL
jgi:hypothetical protein